jgi:hypothetical protein
MPTEGHMHMFIRELQGKKTWEENPLVTIGLSPAILDLGLTRDDLYDHCRRIARDLLRRVHPDRHDGKMTPAVVRFSDAFDLLDDRELFDLALQGFREGHAPRSKEIQTLRTRIRNLEKEIAFLTERLDGYEKPRRKYAN